LNIVAGNADCEAETEAQAEARRRAGEELRWKPLVDVWNGAGGKVEQISEVADHCGWSLILRMGKTQKPSCNQKP